MAGPWTNLLRRRTPAAPTPSTSTAESAATVTVTPPPPPEPESREQRIGDGLRWLGAWSWRWIGIAIAAALLGWLVGTLWVIVLPVFLALVVASVLHPAVVLLARVPFIPRGLSAGLVLILALGAIAGAFTAMAPIVADEWGSIVDDALAGITEVRSWANDHGWLTQSEIDDAIAEARTRLTDSAGSIASGVLTGVNTLTSWLVTMVITLVLTFLFLKDGHRFMPWVQRAAGPRVGMHLDRVLSQVWTTLGGFVRTQAVVSFVDAILIGIALVAIGVPLALPLAVLTFIGGFIPILGAFVAGALAVLVALVSVGINGALLVLAAILVVQQLEGNVLQPWLQAKVMQLHAAVVLLSVTLGSTLFGVAGAFLAVPVAAIVAVVLRYLSEQAEPKGVNR